MMVPFSTLALSPSDDDVEFQPLAEFSVIEDEATDTNSTLKFAMIRRVIIECLTIEDWRNVSFAAGDEIFIDYDFIL